MPHPRRSLALLLVATMALSGCFGLGAKDDPVAPAETNETPATPPTTALPDGRGECNGCAETNKTEEGVGGVDHEHDYWKGRENVMLLDQALVYLGPAPVYPDGEGSEAKSVAYVKLPCKWTEEAETCEPMLVYEGAQTVLVTIASPVLAVASRDGTPLGPPHPSPPSLFLQHRSAADSEWREPVPMTYGTAVEIPVAPDETDMPHSVLSLWVFRITTDSPTSMYVSMTVAAKRGREVLDWPGHPDFYAEADSRVVLDKHVSTLMTGIVGGYLYDSGGTWVAPDKLISHGTGKLVVIANVTSAKSQTGQVPTGFFLESHNATFIGPEIRFGDRWFEKDNKNDLKTYTFEVPVDVAGMDGPYQPTSRWGFRLMATFADIDFPASVPLVGSGIGLCPGCFDYEIEYDVVVIALKADEEPATPAGA